MTHPSDETLALLAHGRLHGDELGAIESHLDGCAACRTLVAAVSNGSAPYSPPERTQLKPGEQLGRYEIESLIAAGGMGVLYAALDTQLNRRVVLKLMRPAFGGELGKVRLLREAQAMASLAHPNVVSVWELGESDGRVFVAMELVEGETFRERMKSPGSWKDVMALLAQAGRGLSAAHAAGVIHRDFKPENVLVGRDGRARVVDFGLARPELVAEEEAPRNLPMKVTHTGTMLGTPAYMSPEQLAGKPADARSDQYGFCVTLYEALAGKRPFLADSLEELRARVAGGMPPPPKDGPVPAHVWAALARGLQPSPERRFPDMDALLDVLSAALPAAGKSERRWPRVLRPALVAVLATTLGGGLATWALRRQPAASPLPAHLEPAPASEQQDAIELVVAAQRVFDVPGVQRLAAGDASIASVQTNGSNQVLIGGVSPGKTTVLAWAGDGTRRSWTVTVTGEARGSFPSWLDVLEGETRTLAVPGLRGVREGRAGVVSAHVDSSGGQLTVTGLVAGQWSIALWGAAGTPVECEVRVTKLEGTADVTLVVGQEMDIPVAGAVSPLLVFDDTIVGAALGSEDGVRLNARSPGRTRISVPTMGKSLTLLVDVLRNRLAPDEVREYFLDHVPELYACAKPPRPSRKTPEPGSVRFFVAPDGTVAGVTVYFGDGSTAMEDACAVERMKEWAFPRSMEGAAAVTYPISPAQSGQPLDARRGAEEATWKQALVKLGQEDFSGASKLLSSGNGLPEPSLKYALATVYAASLESREDARHFSDRYSKAGLDRGTAAEAAMLDVLDDLIEAEQTNHALDLYSSWLTHPPSPSSRLAERGVVVGLRVVGLLLSAGRYRDRQDLLTKMGTLFPQNVELEKELEHLSEENKE